MTAPITTPTFAGGSRVGRRFDPALTDDPIGWLIDRLGDLPGLLAGAELDPGRVDPDDARQLAAAAPEIGRAVAGLLDRVRRGELGQPPAPASGAEPGPLGVRAGWLLSARSRPA